MKLENILKEAVLKAVSGLYGENPDEKLIQVQKTKKEFTGDLTIVIFPLVRFSKKSPEQTATEVGEYLDNNELVIESFNVIKGFLNLEISKDYYLSLLNNEFLSKTYGLVEENPDAETYMVEYSSPNTNKPLHLGHIRNNLLGYSICSILKANGKKVIKTNIVNDRGIHICKSMLAWQKWGSGVTPESTGLKGDKLVGDYYVMFDKEYKGQIKTLIDEGITPDEAEKKAPIIIEAQEMLRRWEAKDSEIWKLWKTMNGWVYKGFNETYERLGVNFDKIYYESDTYVVGRDTVLDGLKKGIFYQRDDNSVWANLTENGLDEKILLRSDGTSVYMTQDIGTAQLRQKDYQPDKMVYVVGNEQNYHFKVLAIILEKLGFNWASDLYHMSYGMVELPEGKMKSREGTVVDADDLIDEMIETAGKMADELGKLEGMSENERLSNYRIIGLGALKYFILKVDPVKNMTFDPKESIDFNGNTGPFIQYTYARIQSVFRKANEAGVKHDDTCNLKTKVDQKEKKLLKLLYDYPQVISDAASNFSPALIANYIYELVKEYNQFYHDYPIIKEADTNRRTFRFLVSKAVSNTVKSGMKLLGIEVPERM